MTLVTEHDESESSREICHFHKLFSRFIDFFLFVKGIFLKQGFELRLIQHRIDQLAVEPPRSFIARLSFIEPLNSTQHFRILEKLEPLPLLEIFLPASSVVMERRRPGKLWHCAWQVTDLLNVKRQPAEILSAGKWIFRKLHYSRHMFGGSEKCERLMQ